MAQNPKGGGLSGTFGGTSSAQFGVQRTNDFMEKATWTLGASIIILILLSIILTGQPTQSKNASPAGKEDVNKSAPKPSAPAQKAPVQLPAQK
jgi:preprotein translocase subunit SecG